MRRIPLCVLHAGAEKTGTTSLQYFLHMNEAALVVRGIWIPRALLANPGCPPYNHLKLSTASRRSYGRPDDLQSALGLKSLDEVEAHRAQIKADLAMEFLSLPFMPRLVIVSSEYLHSRLRTCEDLIRVRSLLSPFCESFHAVFYLRRQDDIARSIAAMALWHGASQLRLIPDFNTPHGFDEVLGVDQLYFDHAATISRLESVFGFVTPRLYEEHPDIVSDFFDFLQEDITTLPRPPRQNGGLNQMAAEFLLHLHSTLSTFPQREILRSRILPYLAAHYSGQLKPASADVANRFLTSYAIGNEAVRKKFFPTYERLFCSPPERQESPQLTQQDAMNLLISILRTS